jgi:hypothetical protein
MAASASPNITKKQLARRGRPNMKILFVNTS